MKPPCLLLLVFCIFTLVISGCLQSGPETMEVVPVQTTEITPSPAYPGPVMTTVLVTVTEVQPRGVADPDFLVDISVPEKIEAGTTILADNHDPSSPRIIEVNRLGEIVWQYPLPPELKAYTNPGWDVEPLPGGNILTVLPRNCIIEIDRQKQIVWKYSDPKVSHDADRLANGNTLVVFGANDKKEDAQVKEVDPKGNIVWSWHAADNFDREPYSSISDEGWTHTNAVSRLENGNTLVSLRNFDLIAEIDPSGNLVRTTGEGLFDAQHDPAVLPGGSMLVANHVRPNEVIEIGPAGDVTWRFQVVNRSSMPVRDANRLRNKNTLITASDRILEVTPDSEVVWQFRLAAGGFTDKSSASGRGFYKAERIPA